VVLFVAGLLGIGYETVIDKAEKPTLIVLFAAMIGLPAFLRKDDPPPTPQTPASPPKEGAP
jgi:hypothetical protein